MVGRVLPTVSPIRTLRRPAALAARTAERLSDVGSRYPLALIALGVVLYATGPIMLQASNLSGPAFSFWRLWVGTGALLLLTLSRGRRPRVSAEGRRWTIYAGLAFGVHQLLFMTATKMTSVVDVQLMNAMAPIATAVGAWWLFRERPGRRFWAWSLLAIGGGAFLALEASGPTGDPVGMGLAIANVVFFAAFFLCSKRSRDHIDVLPYLTGVIAVAAVLVSAFALLAGVDVHTVTRTDLLLAAGVGIGPGILGHFVMTWPLRWVAANIPPVIRLAQPAVAGLMAWFILGEALSLHHLVGGIVVVAGAAGAVGSRDGKALQARARQAAPAPATPVPAR